MLTLFWYSMKSIKQGKGIYEMAEIIDFEFYRKFKIILPVRPRNLDGKKLYEDEERETRTYRRRRRTVETKSKVNEED